MKKAVFSFLCLLLVSFVSVGCSIQEHSSVQTKPPLHPGGTLSFDGGKLISRNGGLFYTTNTESEISLSDVGLELTGAFLCDSSFSGESSTGYASLYISEDSKWIVTGNSMRSKLDNKGTIVDPDGNSVSITDKAGNEIVKGEGIYHITIK